MESKVVSLKHLSNSTSNWLESEEYLLTPKLGVNRTY